MLKGMSGGDNHRTRVEAPGATDAVTLVCMQWDGQVVLAGETMGRYFHS